MPLRPLKTTPSSRRTLVNNACGMASQPPRGKPPKRFRAAAAALRGDAPPPQPTASSVLDRDLGDAAARLLRREAEAAPPPPASGDEFPTAMAERSGGKVALHNGRFLRRTLADTAAHNARLRNAPFAADRRRRSPSPPPPPPPAPRRDEGRGPRRVEVVLPDDRATGILFERDAASGRPVILGFAASCRAAVVDALRPGMVLAKIAGVRCKAIDYARSLELVRALEKPLTLEFEAPKRRRSPSPSSSSSGSRRRRRRKEKKRRRRSRDERSPG